MDVGLKIALGFVVASSIVLIIRQSNESIKETQQNDGSGVDGETPTPYVITVTNPTSEDQTVTLFGRNQFLDQPNLGSQASLDF